MKCTILHYVTTRNTAALEASHSRNQAPMLGTDLTQTFSSASMLDVSVVVDDESSLSTFSFSKSFLFARFSSDAFAFLGF